MHLPELSIGLIGHVDHGKTTLVRALSGKWTDTHSEEIKRGITIRLGYADVSFYKCQKCGKYSVKEKCSCGTKAEFQRTVSLVDAPGHESLMATMLCGANIMDGALLLVAANETCPQPQTVEHLTALEIIGIENVIIVQNKIDLVSEEEAIKNYESIKTFLSKTKFANAPIIPISAMHSINIDMLIQTIQEKFKTPKRDLTKPPVMFIARSFDINKPGTPPKDLKGGVIGGVLKQGKLKEGEEITILPGYETIERNKKVWKPLNTKITSIIAGGEHLKEISPGGSFGILTELDPSVVRSDILAGNVAGKELPLLREIITFEPTLLERVVGAKEELEVTPIQKGELIMININSSATAGIVIEKAKKEVTCKLKKPISCEKDARVAISRIVGQRWRLIGYGIMKE